jgi:hypothetical protein
MLVDCIYTVNLSILLLYIPKKYKFLTHFLSRQLWENYKRKNGDGLSFSFLVIWLAGDVFNLIGVIMQDLLVTMVRKKKNKRKKLLIPTPLLSLY